MLRGTHRQSRGREMLSNLLPNAERETRISVPAAQDRKAKE